VVTYYSEMNLYCITLYSDPEERRHLHLLWEEPLL
jgi:hypothetical protein